MRRIDLKYGKTTLPFDYDEDRFQILGHEEGTRPLTDAEIGEKLDDPIDSPSLESIVSVGDSVLIVVPDATRRTAAGQVVNLIVRRLIAGGIPAHDIRVIFATGIHRPVTEDEKQTIITPFIAQRIKTLNHDPRDLMQIVRLGETSGGIPVELNRSLLEHDRVILVGGVNFHYFAGFTGGRKLVCPGLASAKTVSETHKLAFDCRTLSRRQGVETGSLDDNAVHEAFIEAVERIDPSFSVNTIVNDAGDAVDLFCGNWKTSHRKACEAYAAGHTVQINEKRDLVVASCGGYPHDINMIQAHKTLDTASHACRDGGTIILLAECVDGLGRNDFLDWFDADCSEMVAEKLCRNYQVNGQTAWSLLKKAERFNIQIVTSLETDVTMQMHLSRRTDRAELLAAHAKDQGFVMPFGAQFRPFLMPHGIG